MLELRSKKVSISNFSDDRPRIVCRISTGATRPMPLRRNEIFLSTDGNVPDGYRGYAIFDGMSTASSVPTVTLPESMSYLRDGDVIGIELERPGVRVLYRRNSPHNTFLVTERCNHYCLMCSQPPREVDDGWLVDEMLEAIPLISAETGELGFTGGEPTLLGDRFLEVLRTAKSYLPETSLHILTNGRTFADADFAKKYAEIDHADMVAGIPIYSDISTRHDYVVQADGAFDGTIRGILNLKRHRQKVELRVVIHKQTYERLPQLAEFIARNLTMVDHVALMGLEITGFTRANLPALWIDPIEYQDELYRAATTLADNGMHVSIYNHQLCLIDRRLWPFARRSISDWKNEYMPECEGCRVQEQCGGFFSSAFHRYSDHIAAITEEFGLV